MRIKLSEKLSELKRASENKNAKVYASICDATDAMSVCDIGTLHGYCQKLIRRYYGAAGIDMIAGPSEILIIADESADAKLLASDLLSQAEHDEQAASILVTISEDLAKKVQQELDRQTALLERKDIISKSLETNGAIIIAKDIEEAIKIADEVAPEHLEVCTENAGEVAMKLSNAGAIFVGNFSPEPLGDYFAGPSHVLPTSGSARYSSVLSVDT